MPELVKFTLLLITVNSPEPAVLTEMGVAPDKLSVLLLPPVTVAPASINKLAMVSLKPFRSSVPPDFMVMALALLIRSEAPNLTVPSLMAMLPAVLISAFSTSVPWLTVVRPV
ncbi:MAG: hypothetical protein ACK559_25630 [bacterium]